MSVRKPYNDRAGYVVSRRNDVNRGWVVIYVAAEQGIDAGVDPSSGRPYKYIASCETHDVFVGGTSIPSLRSCLKVPDFCEECMACARDSAVTNTTWSVARSA